MAKEARWSTIRSRTVVGTWPNDHLLGGGHAPKTGGRVEADISQELILESLVRARIGCYTRYTLIYRRDCTDIGEDV